MRWPPVAVTVAFTILVVVMVALFVIALDRAGERLGAAAEERRRWRRRGAALLGAWLAITGGLAGAGILQDFSRVPPPAALLLLTTLALTVVVASSRVGARLAFGLSIAGLVGFQSFRIAVELLLLALARAGTMPLRMTLEGWNFDVLTGLSAIPIAMLAARGRCPRWALWLWNLIGFGLLATIVGIAVLSMPLPFQRFSMPGDDPFVTRAPFVWLPTVLVAAALLGHLLLLRRLVARERTGD
ncbi:MAG: hypothetical protein R3A51_15995 [Nannocystaceae bacterium]